MSQRYRLGLSLAGNRCEDCVRESADDRSQHPRYSPRDELARICRSSGADGCAMWAHVCCACNRGLRRGCRGHPGRAGHYPGRRVGVLRGRPVCPGDGWWDDWNAFLSPWGFELDAVGAPVSLWHGLADTRCPPGHARWLVARIPHITPHLPEHDDHTNVEDNNRAAAYAWLHRVAR